MHKSKIFIVGLLFMGLSNCAGNPPKEGELQNDRLEMANPASINCIDQGGQLQIEKHEDDGEFGVCVFEDNRQCEEWALMRGECPSGGVKIRGYVTAAARYCVIAGGTYNAVVDEASKDKDVSSGAGECQFPGGKVCDAGEYYQGSCRKQK